MVSASQNINQNKLQYLMHPQLIQETANGFRMMLKGNFFILMGFYFLCNQYPKTIATLDFSFTVLSVLFFIFIKPRMMKGEIPAYYRRDYQSIKFLMFFMKVFILGGVMRFPILALFYGLNLYLVRNDTVEWEHYKSTVYAIINNPSINALAVGAFALAIFILFYQQRYASIQEFSNGVVEIFSRNVYSEEGAVKEFIRRKDQQLERNTIVQVKYDGTTTMASKTNPMPSTKPYRITPMMVQTNTTMVEEPTAVEQEVTQPATPIDATVSVRRQARR
ncbi:hypothetical protein PP175_26900 (plasmid) [Aneurinibacillus sp. Ricciae_BoGa-3]|uniref:hypothetical protein n=1 Tax=Aneurinibacillus sp. Ricciae_BoGa-3 TaxID=3022697 RepID=UPI0023415E1E|nr:hypothetical protein [Aneurinibacillus sp. Ricciae_BoGa-3]WCK57667.1 hypothetical protein PP175_26900 [Aneurinibacillus sp. Ricciae_BoGa-3]